MNQKAKRRHRFGRLAGMLAAGVLAVGAVSVGATAGAATVTAGTAHGTASTAGRAAPARDQVPWSEVGPGWCSPSTRPTRAGQPHR